MQDAVDQSRQAINDCRDKRQRGELPSYKASAQCSNPRIFAAWQAAQYPHMDLITQWLNAREAASDRVDQHQLSPDQFEQQMDDVTVRLTARNSVAAAASSAATMPTCSCNCRRPDRSWASPRRRVKRS